MLCLQKSVWDSANIIDRKYEVLKDSHFHHLLSLTRKGSITKNSNQTGQTDFQLIYRCLEFFALLGWGSNTYNYLFWIVECDILKFYETQFPFLVRCLTTLRFEYNSISYYKEEKNNCVSEPSLKKYRQTIKKLFLEKYLTQNVTLNEPIQTQPIQTQPILNTIGREQGLRFVQTATPILFPGRQATSSTMSMVFFSKYGCHIILRDKYFKQTKMSTLQYQNNLKMINIDHFRIGPESEFNGQLYKHHLIYSFNKTKDTWKYQNYHNATSSKKISDGEYLNFGVFGTKSQNSILNLRTRKTVCDLYSRQKVNILMKSQGKYISKCYDHCKKFLKSFHTHQIVQMLFAEIYLYEVLESKHLTCFYSKYTMEYYFCKERRGLLKFHCKLPDVKCYFYNNWNLMLQTVQERIFSRSRQGANLANSLFNAKRIMTPSLNKRINLRNKNLKAAGIDLRYVSKDQLFMDYANQSFYCLAKFEITNSHRPLQSRYRDSLESVREHSYKDLKEFF